MGSSRNQGRRKSFRRYTVAQASLSSAKIDCLLAETDSLWRCTVGQASLCAAVPCLTACCQRHMRPRHHTADFCRLSHPVQLHAAVLDYGDRAPCTPEVRARAHEYSAQRAECRCI